MSSSVINTEAALVCTDGDAELLQSLIELYFEQQPQLIDQIRRGLEEKNAHEVERGAHSLKGSISVFAAAEPRQSAFNLETIGKESDWEKAEFAWKDLQEQLSRFEPALRDLDAAITRGELAGN